MHEMSLLKDLLHKVDQIVKEANAVGAKKIKLQLGTLAHISPEHLREHFATESVGSLAEGAMLEIIELNDIHHPHAQEILLKEIEVIES